MDNLSQILRELGLEVVSATLGAGTKLLMVEPHLIVPTRYDLDEQRWWCAHLVGHILMAHLGARQAWCCHDWADPELEHQADVFAGYLLFGFMPRHVEEKQQKRLALRAGVPLARAERWFGEVG